MQKLLIIFSVLFLISFTYKNDNPAYVVFDGEGKEQKFSDILKKIKNADIVFFGELHNNPIAHWLQLEITEQQYKQTDGKIMLGAEMFESDNQLLIDEYLAGVFDFDKFEAEAKLWPNYKTDYRPLVNFAKSNKLPFIATNVPRRYASVVYKTGFDGLESLSDEAKKYIAPLPILYDSTLACYKKMLNMKMGRHSTENLPKAQAVKDATMAYFILKNKKENNCFIHFNGSFHSDNYEGIVWYLKQKNKNLNIVTISTVQQNTLEKLSDDYLNIADFIICTPDNMIITH